MVYRLDFLLGGTPGIQIAHWAMVFFTFLFVTLFFLTLWVHVRKNNIERKMALLEPAYEDLVKAVRFGRAMAEDIQRAVRPQDFPFFQRYLQKTLSSVEELDVSTQRKIADLSGFTAYLKKRIATTHKWEKTLAVRVLASFRDTRNIPLFREILAQGKFIQTVYAAGLGLALCRDTDSVVEVGRRLWQISEKNRDALLLILYVYGKEIAPFALRALEDGTIRDEAAKPVVLDFLSEYPCKNADVTLTRLLQKNPPEILLPSLLNALRRVGTKECVDAVVPYLSHKNFPVRIEAVLAVAALGGQESLPHIEKSLSDENWWVRREAAKGIAGMGPTGIVLLRLLATEAEENPRAAARTVLAELQFNRIAEVGV